MKSYSEKHDSSGDNTGQAESNGVPARTGSHHLGRGGGSRAGGQRSAGGPDGVGDRQAAGAVAVATRGRHTGAGSLARRGNAGAGSLVRHRHEGVGGAGELGRGRGTRLLLGPAGGLGKALAGATGGLGRTGGHRAHCCVGGHDLGRDGAPAGTVGDGGGAGRDGVHVGRVDSAGGPRAGAGAGARAGARVGGGRGQSGAGLLRDGANGGADDNGLGCDAADGAVGDGRCAGGDGVDGCGVESAGAQGRRFSHSAGGRARRCSLATGCDGAVAVRRPSGRLRRGPSASSVCGNACSGGDDRRGLGCGGRTGHGG